MYRVSLSWGGAVRTTNKPCFRLTWDRGGTLHTKHRPKAYRGIPAAKARRVLPLHATQDYLRASLEANQLARIGFSRGKCVNLMLEASYSNFHDTVTGGETHILEALEKPSYINGIEKLGAVRHVKREAAFGALCQMVAPTLNIHEVRSLGIVAKKPVHSLLAQCNSLPVFCTTPCTYNDGCVIAKCGFEMTEIRSQYLMYV